MITLCIPTYNRPHYLGRILQYYRKLNFPYPIIVADSSSGQCRRANKQLVAEVSNGLKITYKEYDSVLPVCAKIAQALSNSGSEFACICADDDFIIPDSISQCVGFLKAHPNFSIAHGSVVMALFLPQTYGTGPETLNAYTYAQLGTKDADDLVSRLMSCFENGGSSFYSVYRRTNLINNLEVIDKNTNYPHFAELLLDTLNCVQGKVKCLDILFMVRQFTPERESAKVTSWVDLIHSDHFDREYDLFSKYLSRELVRKGIPEAASKKTVDCGFHEYTHVNLLNVRKNRWQTMPSQLMRGGWHFLKILFHHEWPDKILRIRHFIANPVESRLQSRCDDDNFSVKKMMDMQSAHYAAFSVVYEYLVKYPKGIDAGIKA